MNSQHERLFDLQIDKDRDTNEREVEKKMLWFGCSYLSGFGGSLDLKMPKVSKCLLANS